MRDRAGWLSGYLSALGFFHQVRVNEGIDHGVHSAIVVLYDFADMDKNTPTGRITFALPKDAKFGDEGVMLQIAETCARQLAMVRIPKRPAPMSPLWPAHIISLVHGIFGVNGLKSEDPAADLKRIANICAFFATPGEASLLDDNTPAFIGLPMLRWQDIAEGRDPDALVPVAPETLSQGAPEGDAEAAVAEGEQVLAEGAVEVLEPAKPSLVLLH